MNSRLTTEKLFLNLTLILTQKDETCIRKCFCFLLDQDRTLKKLLKMWMVQKCWGYRQIEKFLGGYKKAGTQSLGGQQNVGHKFWLGILFCDKNSGGSTKFWTNILGSQIFGGVTIFEQQCCGVNQIVGQIMRGMEKNVVLKFMGSIFVWVPERNRVCSLCLLV